MIHPGNDLAEAGEYAGQSSLVPANRDDIKWLPQEITADWKRIHLEEDKLTIIKLDGCVVTVAPGGLQKAVIDTKRRKGQAASAIKRAARSSARSLPSMRREEASPN